MTARWQQVLVWCNAPPFFLSNTYYFSSLISDSSVRSRLELVLFCLSVWFGLILLALISWYVTRVGSGRGVRGGNGYVRVGALVYKYTCITVITKHY